MIVVIAGKRRELERIGDMPLSVVVFRLVFVSCQDAQAPSVIEEITYLGAEVEYKRFVFAVAPHSEGSSGKHSAFVLVSVCFVFYGGREGLLCVSSDCRSQGDSQEQQYLSFRGIHII